MIGDRLDNDIAPADRLGMKTAWVRWPDRSAKGWSPADVYGRAYLRSLERVAQARSQSPGSAEPDGRNWTALSALRRPAGPALVGRHPPLRIRRSIGTKNGEL